DAKAIFSWRQIGVQRLTMTSDVVPILVEPIETIAKRKAEWVKQVDRGVIDLNAPRLCSERRTRHRHNVIISRHFFDERPRWCWTSLYVRRIHRDNSIRCDEPEVVGLSANDIARPDVLDWHSSHAI